MELDILFILLGYLSGSLMFAYIVSYFGGKSHLILNSNDRNPGTASAFTQCGFWYGIVTLLCDILKGFLPISLYLVVGGDLSRVTMVNFLIIAAPVIGHAFPLFFNFNGGKCIAVTFGVLLGLISFNWYAVLIFVAIYLFLSTICRITPHFYRTILVYILTFIFICIFDLPKVILIGFEIIMLIVSYRFYKSKEQLDKFKIHFLWFN